MWALAQYVRDELNRKSRAPLALECDIRIESIVRFVVKKNVGDAARRLGEYRPGTGAQETDPVGVGGTTRLIAVDLVGFDQPHSELPEA